MKQLYQLISKCKEHTNCVAISGISGKIAGEKLLLVNHEIAFQTDNADALASCWESILQQAHNGLCELESGTCYVEYLAEKERMIVCGAGTVGQEVIILGKQLGLTVVAMEDREEFAKIAKDLGADEVYCMSFAKGFSTLEQRNADYYVVMTREHQYDKECLENILKRRYAYVGMMASKNRALLLKEALKKEGIDEVDVEAIHSPIGLSIKAQTPAEIAVSIWAEVIQCKNSKEKTEGYSKDLLEILTDDSSQKGYILATIVKRIGSAPRDVGTKMLIGEDGTYIGSVGGGWIEANVLKLANEMFQSGQKTCLYETDKNSKEAVLCGGYETIYLEKIKGSLA